MNSFDIPAGTIVVGLDGSRQSLHALEWAVEQALAERRPLTLAHALIPFGGNALDPSGHLAKVPVEDIDDETHGIFSEARDVVARRHGEELELHEVVRAADPRQLLMDLGADAKMLVLGSRGRGPVRSLLLGSVGVALVRHASCPVVVHRPGNAGIVRQGVVAGVDGTERSLPVLEFAYRVAAQRDLPLTVVHAYWDVPTSVPEMYWTDPPEGGSQAGRLAVAEAVAGLGEKYPEVRATTEAVRGMTRSVLAEHGDKAHLLVVGAHHGGLPTELLFGAVSTDLVEHASCPVAVVPID